ncbi:MAG: ABC transporter substrate-binding protein [Oscillospiraceae bacterium]|nr:ABC transporter substrate-binding protein [Oscillospiraceae bacterium]
MKRLVALLLVLCMVFAFAACGGNKDAGSDGAADGSGDAQTGGGDASADSGEAKRDDLNIAYSQDRGTLNPLFMIGYDSMYAMLQVYQQLWDINSAGEMEWVLATGIEYVSDTVWHIKIREGVKFQNGNPLTAEDVVYSLVSANSREGEPAFLPYMDMENTKALDDYTVEFVLKQYDFSYLYSMTYLPIFDKESFDPAVAATTPNGTGPYELADYVVNSHIKLQLRTDGGYWGEMPSIKYLNFLMFTEDAQKTNALQTGALDIARVPYQDIEYIESVGGYTVDLQKSSNGGGRALYFNATEHSDIFYNNPDARKAVAMAIDAEAVCAIAYSGYATPARMLCSTGCIDTKEEYYDQGVYATGYNPEEAKALAEKAGLIGKTLTISTNGTSDAIVTAELIQADLEAIGIHVEINNYDSGSWLAVAFDPSNAGDMLVDFTGVPSNTIAQNLSCWYLYHLGGGYTTIEFEGKDTLDGIAAVVMGVRDEEERAKMNKQMFDILNEQLLWFGICDLTTATAYPEGLKGYEVQNQGFINYGKLSW